MATLNPGGYSPSPGLLEALHALIEAGDGLANPFLQAYEAWTHSVELWRAARDEVAAMLPPRDGVPSGHTVDGA